MEHGTLKKTRKSTQSASLCNILFGLSWIRQCCCGYQAEHNSHHETALIALWTIEWASQFHVMCLCNTPTPPLPPPPHILQGVWPSLGCQPPPSTQEASISDPHQTSCKEVGPLKTSPERGAEKSGGAGPPWMGVVLSGDLTALALLPTTPQRPPPPPRIPLWSIFWT